MTGDATDSDIELDHLVLLVKHPQDVLEALSGLGLTRTRSSSHPGQGTENACFCFDNLFLEVLWICDAADAKREPAARLGLTDRVLSKTSGACPIGLSWRGASAGIRAWRYAPGYLPAGIAIDVALDSDVLAQPLMFQSPGAVGPLEWPQDRRGALQHESDMGMVSRVQLTAPAGFTESPALRSLTTRELVALEIGTGSDWRVDFSVQSLDKQTTRELWIW